MPVSVTRHSREFSPSEVEFITNASVALQRDWRRRGILPERKSGGWSKFSLDDLIKIYVLKFFSDSGFSVKEVGEFASLAVLPVHTNLLEMPGAVAFEGEEISDRLKEMIAATAIKDAGVAGASRYLIMAHGDDIPLKQRVRRVKSLNNLEDWLSDYALEGFTAVSFDLLAANIAAGIAASADSRIFTFKVESAK